MASLKEIRRRIHSIDNIRQITKSMEMIAAARFQKAHLKAINSNKFRQAMRELVGHLTATKAERSHPLLNNKREGVTALIVAGSDRGLCGAYNSNLFAAIDSFLKKNAEQEVELILFGRRVIDFYRRKRCKIGAEIPDWGGKITLAEIEKLSKDVIEKFLNGTYKSLELIYTEHQTIFTRKIMAAKLLPIEIPESEVLLKQDYVFEPNIEELFTKLLPEYISIEIQNMLNQAYASELAARVSAMRAASTNAEEIREKLLLERNKLRQTSITKEVLEISSGTEAL